MASYPYEQLNDESFQELSQSLLLKAFPDLQCFPVGQPDGGRDAIVRILEDEPGTTRFNLFQIKFARRERDPSEARKWLLETLRKELPKVQQQVEKGAKRFVLVTNIPGTAHPEVGSKDKLQDLLDEYIPIPAEAWWREDLDRRLDDAWDLKFTYPALFTGADLLRLVIEGSPSEDRERRQYAIRAFLSGQFDADREVKFKQADLENDIFELFTDVPLVPRTPSGRRQKSEDQLATAFRRAAMSASESVDPLRILHWLEIALRGESDYTGYYSREATWMGTASLLLDSDFQQAEPLVILEGAPGQGKSTIAQYICQIHRMRFLDHQRSETANLAHTNAALRLPFKVEIRDFANWLAGGNPYGGDPPDASSRTLEGFLAALIRHESGGSDFNVSDLHATLSSSPALIVLDGLDEVAEIKQRGRVVDAINSAVSRLSGLAKSLQVVVTSRPTAFINSPVLPRRTFATYSLEDLTRPLITEYAERWLRSREIDESDASDVRQILNDKLDEPHLHDLARNPMQLAILLSLIHRRGISLPDKRTVLYDSYIDIFFDRESEKAAVVRDNRDLLIRIHRYLAWELQSRAEVDSTSTSGGQPSGTSLSGSITEGELRVLLREYLEKDGSDPALVERLFSGVVERVVAIVSRVQGVYEFDVQTLREYFAARHLYHTAPDSSAGDERPAGTISDRWHALSRNYYWLNVARFYAGCYKEGELPSLIDDLLVLSNDEVFRLTSHPQLLTATLLGDWVFSQRPRASQAAVDLLLQPRGLRMLMAGSGAGLRQVEEVIVRDPAGRRRLIAACKELVRPNRPIEPVIEVIRKVLRPNSEPEELVDWWLEELRSADQALAYRWCVLGDLLQCWSIVDLGTVKELLGRENIPSSSVINGLLHANRSDILESNEELFEDAVEAVLSGERVGRSRGSSILQRLALSVDLTSLSGPNTRGGYLRRRSLLEFLSEFRGYEVHDYKEDNSLAHYTAAKRCTRLVQAFMSAAERPLAEWNTSIEPWGQIVQQGIDEFGERRIFVEFANLAAGIQSKVERCQDSPDLFDFHRPIVRRARYARLRAASRKWWSGQLQSASNAEELWMALLLFATWAGTRTFEELAEEFDTLVGRLGTFEWYSLHSSLHSAVGVNSRRSWIKPLGIRVSALPPSLSARTAALLAERCTRATKDELYERYLTDYKGDDSIVVSLRADVQVRRAFENKAKWSQAIEALRSSYRLGGAPTSRAFSPHLRRNLTLPDTVAREIVDQPLELPTILVGIAEVCCRQLDAARILPVGRVATDEGWFTD